MFLSVGTMLKRFLEAKSFIFHIPKPIQVPKLTYVRLFCISCMYTHHVCMLCVYSMHLFYVCILSMYSMHVFYTGHLVDPQGPFGRMFRKHIPRTIPTNIEEVINQLTWTILHNFIFNSNLSGRACVMRSFSGGHKLYVRLAAGKVIRSFSGGQSIRSFSGGQSYTFV